MFKQLCAAMALGLGLSAANAQDVNFGIISTEATQNLKADWQPLLDDMAKQTGLKIKAFFAPDYAGIIEGMRFSQMRSIINESPDLIHNTKGLSDAELLKKVAPDSEISQPEGLFAPDSYEVDTGSSDLKLYQLSYQTMQRNLKSAWEERQSGLPYQNPYELLTMASIVEKETGHKDDREDVAAVFINRLNIGMRLQTDPTVIYGMGDAYQGKIRKADLQRDTPYNTYTRAGLTPTPISLPGKAALEAAAHPSSEKYLYFVSKMDGSGKSKFSHDLNEHNAAVREFILKKK